MLRSLYAGVSGMRNFQTKMDVIANNIANVNTTAYKSGRVRFQDMLSQTLASAQSPSTDGLGGVNPQQVGLGVKVGSIDTMMTGGALQPTNRDLDFAIEGEGLFAVTDGIMKAYTRDGAFYTDYKGNLVNSSGLKVLGYSGPEKEMVVGDESFYDPEGTNTLGALKIPPSIGTGTDDVKELQSYNIDGTGRIIGIYGEGETFLLGQIAVVTFSNTSGLEKTGSNNYVKSSNSGVPQEGIAGSAGKGVIRQGFTEMSNVDLANEFTEMIITSRAYQANSRSITTSDEMLQELINLKR